MFAFTLKRVISGILLLVVLSVATFFLAHLAIGDPTAGLIGNSATPAQQAALRTKIGYDQPILVQFWNWFSAAIHGDFGVSWKNWQSVGDQLSIRVPVTLSVVTFGIILAAVFGALFGVFAARHPGSLLDRFLNLVSVVLFALPGFWVALILVIWFALDLQWFPAVGYTPVTESFTGWLSSITLPAVALSLSAIVMVGSQLRNGYVNAAGQDYVRTLRSRGLSERRVTTHIIRNASPAALTVLALMFVGLLSGAIVVEIIFNLPGIGTLANQSAQTGDIPVILGITVVTIVFVVIVNFLLDLVLGWVNPKARVK